MGVADDLDKARRRAQDFVRECFKRAEDDGFDSIDMMIAAAVFSAAAATMSPRGHHDTVDMIAEGAHAMLDDVEHVLSHQEAAN